MLTCKPIYLSILNHAVQLTGTLCIVAGLLCNKFVIERLFSSDGNISALPVNIGILILQLILISAGILYLNRAFRALRTIGLLFLVLFISQFWIRVFLEVPFPEKRMFKALPTPPSLFEAGQEYRDQISVYESRFAEIKTMLPSNGSIGYITSPELPPEEAHFHYGLATYALVPLLVERNISHPFVVGNFPGGQVKDRLPIPPNFTLIKDCENGIMLFRRQHSQ